MINLDSIDLLCIDFDETLFNHYAFSRWADGVLSNDGYIAPGAYSETIDNYHQQITPILRLYKHEEHAQDILGKDWSFVAGYLKNKLRIEQHDFCYGDSHAFLCSVVERVKDVRILSFGHGEYQRFKMSICPVLRELDLPIHIVGEPKAHFITTHFEDAKSGVLIDDKFPLSLPDNFLHILIDRKGHYSKDAKPDSVKTVHSLHDIMV